MNRRTLEGFLAVIAAGGTVVCNAATRDRLLAAFRSAGAPLTSVRFRVSAHQPDGHVTAISLDCADPSPYALTAENGP